MNPAAILLVVQGIQAILTAAPQVAELVVKAKELIAALFQAKAITKEQQDAIFAHIDGLAALHNAGIVPLHWQVEPDPA
jgi:hypothetical protein